VKETRKYVWYYNKLRSKRELNKNGTLCFLFGFASFSSFCFYFSSNGFCFAARRKKKKTKLDEEMIFGLLPENSFVFVCN
jgi:hypothetical protein